jgi:HUS1 checkpoint protein
MKFGAKILDSINIAHFTHIISTVSKLCAKSSSDKTCVLKLTADSIYLILPEFASNNAGNGGMGRTSFWMSIDPKNIFEFYVCEGKSPDENFILLEVQPESLLRALKSSTNIKMVRIKLTKRQSPCITVELDLYSITSKISSRTITHDIPIKVISTSKLSDNEFQEPDVSKTTLSIQMPPLKLIKHMIERMKSLNEFVYLEATNKGALTLKIEADAVSVSTYFRNLNNLPIDSSDHNQTRVANSTRKLSSNNDTANQEDEENQQNEDEYSFCSVRLSLKRLSDFVNALQFQPTKIICNFFNHRYAHFFVVHDNDLLLQYLISSVLA